MSARVSPMFLFIREIIDAGPSVMGPLGLRIGTSTDVLSLGHFVTGLHCSSDCAGAPSRRPGSCLDMEV